MDSIWQEWGNSSSKCIYKTMIKKMKNFKLINKMYLDILLRNNIIFVYIKTITDINLLMYSYYSNVNFLFLKFSCVLFIFFLLFNLFHSMKKKDINMQFWSYIFKIYHIILGSPWIYSNEILIFFNIMWYNTYILGRL